MSPVEPAVAAGHCATAEVARDVLREGGNAFDAAVAGLLAACVAEPVLASLGGGGFLLASPAAGPARLFDFFVQTPRHQRPGTEFREVVADFGTARQAFHIGRGSVATPGVAAGVFDIHRELGTMPLRDLFAPAIEMARAGVEVRAFDAYVVGVVSTILASTAPCAALFASPRTPGALIAEGDRLRLPALADTLDALSIEGADLFYRGEISAAIARNMEGAGHLERSDLEQYRVEIRRPLEARCRQFELRANPPPSSGGLLTAFALSLLHPPGHTTDRFAPPRPLDVALAMEQTSTARMDALAAGELSVGRTLEPAFVDRYRRNLLARSRSNRGTTQISIVDRHANAASLTVSNGESSAYVVPDTGVLLNNMLGEEDLNPGGFQRWACDRRMTSMMNPTVARDRSGRIICLGSGGSNRIRSAILQVLVNLIHRELEPEAAVEAPRVHYEATGPEQGLLSVEGGIEPAQLQALRDAFASHHLWEDKNMFFGGVHTVVYDGHRTVAVGDSRRGGSGLSA